MTTTIPVLPPLNRPWSIRPPSRRPPLRRRFLRPTTEAADDRLPEGVYHTAELARDQLIASAVAAGFDEEEVAAYLDRDGTDRTLVIGLRLAAGGWSVLLGIDGATEEVGWRGTYEVVDPDTVVATDPDGSVTLQYEIDRRPAHPRAGRRPVRMRSDDRPRSLRVGSVHPGRRTSSLHGHDVLVHEHVVRAPVQRDPAGVASQRAERRGAQLRDVGGTCCRPRRAVHRPGQRVPAGRHRYDAGAG